MSFTDTHEIKTIRTLGIIMNPLYKRNLSYFCHDFCLMSRVLPCMWHCTCNCYLISHGHAWKTQQSSLKIIFLEYHYKYWLFCSCNKALNIILFSFIFFEVPRSNLLYDLNALYEKYLHVKHLNFTQFKANKC